MKDSLLGRREAAHAPLTHPLQLRLLLRRQNLLQLRVHLLLQLGQLLLLFLRHLELVLRVRGQPGPRQRAPAARRWAEPELLWYVPLALAFELRRNGL